MDLALAEAVKARGQTSPNPMVGAVLVRKGKLLAKGYHHRAGLPHAEIEAFKQIKDPRGATLYVTLEPCCHQGKRTPPCTEAILRSGIKKVVVGTLDPNPKVSGRGVKILLRAGIAVKIGVLKSECRELNAHYNRWITTGNPWVILKTASSLDGRIALANGKSRWITGEASRLCVHELRGEVDGILVGNQEDQRLRSGVSVVLCERPSMASVDVRGGAPGTRET
ncbi:MAG: bifunctional diaminohydroxyphosphoribosylaminopyrimidine deaminase/5-amino-6-(5-phosphoribosylamino)uracil reductase RibD, partial [Deltaproteobacteria bacterium]|nr:bifunctional diaminohydroxyphosphoribosylaminopyrimidine deaminase/5-amino-6-(5-phosphoribosylamino)uracil reductase RibD [Deltaproteobacteria bacterium]